MEIVPPSGLSQSLRFSIHRQDGARYAVNTLGHTFARSPAKMTADAEDVILNMTRQIANNPSMAIKTSVLNQLGSFADTVSGILAGTAGVATLASMVNLAKPVLSSGAATAAVNALKLMA